MKLEQAPLLAAFTKPFAIVNTTSSEVAAVRHLVYDCLARGKQLNRTAGQVNYAFPRVSIQPA